MDSTPSLPPALAGMLDAINARDVDALGQFFTADVSYQLLVPHPPVVGRDNVIKALGDCILAADRVRWDVVSWVDDGNRAFVERVDRFWFGQNEAAIECTGVFEFDQGKMAAVRDYADLDTWRRRTAEALGTEA